MTNDEGPTPERDGIFVSYSHNDAEWLVRLQKVLAPIAESLNLWDDTAIKPGAEWRKEINAAMNRAKVAVLLVTQDFLASKFIADNELPPLLAAAADDGVTIFWIAVKPALYRVSPIAKYQSANDPATPLASFQGVELDAEIVKIAEKILEAMAA